MLVFRFRNASVSAVECLHFISGLLAFWKRGFRGLIDDAVLLADVGGDVGRQEAHVALVTHRDEGGLLRKEPTGKGT